MSGENCTLTAAGYGARDVRVTALRHGVVIMGTESETRDARTFYPMREALDDFSISIIFSRNADYRDFIDWTLGFVRRISDPNQVPIAMRVELPARGFDQVGIPRAGLGYREKDNDVTWSITLQFVGVEDAITRFDSPLISQFQLLADAPDQSTTQYFYPAGVQLDQDARDEAAAILALSKTTSFKLADNLGRRVQ